MRYIAEDKNNRIIESFESFIDILIFFASEGGGFIDIYDFKTFEKKTIIINSQDCYYITTRKVDKIFWF